MRQSIIERIFPFRFDKMCLQHTQLEDQLAEWRNIKIEGTTLFHVASKLRNVKKKVEVWNKRCFGNILYNKSKIKEDLQMIQEIIQQEGYTMHLVTRENEKMVEYHDIVTKEEICWRQRSRSI